MLSIIFLILLMLIFLLPLICFPAPSKSEGKVDVLIVLGCPAYADHQMSATQKMRVEKAADVIQKYHIQACIMTGGKAHNQIAEAHIMAAYLIKLTGFEALIEDQSTTTYENMKFAQMICQKHGYQSIGILTSRYHLRRAYAMSLKFFDDVTMFAAPYHFTWKKMIREYVSRWQYLFIELMNHVKR